MGFPVSFLEKEVMDQAQIVQNVAKYVEEKMIGEGSGHDWWHIVSAQ
jgi:uncharacterized protein